MGEHALRAWSVDATGVEYTAGDGNLSDSGNGLFLAMWIRQSRTKNISTFVHIIGDNSFLILVYRSGADLVFNGPNGAACARPGIPTPAGSPARAGCSTTTSTIRSSSGT